MALVRLDEVLEQVRAALAKGEIQQAVERIVHLPPADQAEIFEELSDAEQALLIAHLPPEDSADILEDLEDTDAAELTTELAASFPLERLATILREMEPDELADLLGDLDPWVTQQLLAHLADKEATLQPLLVHPDDTAGGLMTSEVAALREDMTCSQALTALRQLRLQRDDITYIFVVDAERHLKGVVSLFKILTSSPQTLLKEIMDPQVIAVRADADQEEAAKLMARYDLFTLPVVDHNGVLVGAITADDILDVVEEEASEDIQRLGGSEPLDEPYLDTSPWILFRKRIGWLLLLFITESLTGTVLRHYEDELARVVALSFFIPLLIGTGGNSGSQTSSTIIRALAVGDISLKDALRVFWHEMRTAILLGAGMAVVGLIRALLWGSTPMLALTVALTLFVIVLWAASLGSLLPLAATALKIDPTVVSGPVMSTMVDATGLVIYFTIARWLLGL